MKSFKSLVKPACAIALVLGMSSPWFAYAKEDNCRPEHHHMGPHPKQFKKLIQALDLSEEQKVQAQALQAQMKADREADKGAVQAQREAFHNLVMANASEAELKAHADQMAASMSKHMVQSSLHMRAFREILTVEQKVKMDAMKAERKARHANGDSKSRHEKATAMDES